MASVKKVEEVKQLSEKLAKAKALFLTEYRGLTHQQMEQLRRALKKSQAEFIVAKNTLLKIAMDKWNKEAGNKIEPELKNPTATLFAYGDEVAAIKELANFIKNVQLPKIKIGFFGGSIATESDFQKLSTLPSREVLLATLAGRLQSPISGFHYALNWNLSRFVRVLDNIKEKKPKS